MSLTDKTVYVFVRQDLPLADQLTQSNHATMDMARRLTPEPGYPRLITIGMPDVKALGRALAKLDANSIPHFAYADMDHPEWGITAVTTFPLDETQCQALKNYRLWNVKNQKDVFMAAVANVHG